MMLMSFPLFLSGEMTKKGFEGRKSDLKEPINAYVQWEKRGRISTWRNIHPK